MHPHPMPSAQLRLACHPAPMEGQAVRPEGLEGARGLDRKLSWLREIRQPINI